MTFATNVTTQADDVGGIFEAGISGATACVFFGLQYSTLEGAIQMLKKKVYFFGLPIERAHELSA